MTIINQANWWQQLASPYQTLLTQVWVAVGTPGYAGPQKKQWQQVLDERFGADAWRLSHYVRGRIVAESSLSYLGFGIQPPTASWGNILEEAQQHIFRAPWLAIFPGVLIFLAAMTVNYIGDGLRDGLDPYLVRGAKG